MFAVARVLFAREELARLRKLTTFLRHAGNAAFRGRPEQRDFDPPPRPGPHKRKKAKAAAGAAGDGGAPAK